MIKPLIWVGALLTLGLNVMGSSAETISTTTSFHCVPTKVPVGQENPEPQTFKTVYATVARRGNRQTPPMILWTTSLGKFTSQERCKVVSDRLSEVVAQKDGKLRNLYLTNGRVDGQPVVCHVEGLGKGCNRKNTLFTLRPEDKGNEGEILRKLVTFSVKGSGSAVEQSDPKAQVYASFGEEIEKSLTTASSTSSGI